MLNEPLFLYQKFWAEQKDEMIEWDDTSKSKVNVKNVNYRSINSRSRIDLTKNMKRCKSKREILEQ
jgi:hypothetical protein